MQRLCRHVCLTIAEGCTDFSLSVYGQAGTGWLVTDMCHMHGHCLYHSSFIQRGQIRLGCVYLLGVDTACPHVLLVTG